MVKFTLRHYSSAKEMGSLCIGDCLEPMPVRSDAENLATPEVHPRNFQPVDSLFTDYAIPTHEDNQLINNKLINISIIRINFSIYLRLK
jgi:hypothetical protein